MPSPKQAPTMTKMKVTESTWGRISTRKIQKHTHEYLNEAYIQPSTESQVSTTSRSSNFFQVHIIAESFNSILSMLRELSESKCALLSRIEKVEQRQSVAGFNHQILLLFHETEAPFYIRSHTVGQYDRQ